MGKPSFYITTCRICDEPDVLNKSSFNKSEELLLYMDTIEAVAFSAKRMMVNRKFDINLVKQNTIKTG